MERISAFLDQGTRVEIRSQEHSWYADEPPKAGGGAASPYELLLGSLAACTVLTLRLYTQRKGIELQWIKAEYDFEHVHADDCKDCEEADRGMIERVQAYVTLGGTFDEAQRARLTQIVSRCPVHKTLTNGINIIDHVAFEEHLVVS